jgi:hypothetical protein
MPKTKRAKVTRLTEELQKQSLRGQCLQMAAMLFKTDEPRIVILNAEALYDFVYDGKVPEAKAGDLILVSKKISGGSAGTEVAGESK